jgi:organic hydroperoxide reductase OsmC/OhrA
MGQGIVARVGCHQAVMYISPAIDGLHGLINHHRSSLTKQVNMTADIHHHSGKTDKQFLFETSLNWLGGNRGIVTASDTGSGIYVSLPTAFGGEEGNWSPEHLFLASLSSCFMSTCLAFAHKMALPVSHFSCSAIGHVEKVESKYCFTRIDLYPQLLIGDETLREKANEVMEKTHQHCLVANSVRANVFFHSQVALDEHPRFNTMG